MLEILPYYLLGFLGLYVYFSVSDLVDMDGKYRKLRINLTDYLENHMAPRLAVLEEADAAEKGKTAGEKRQNMKREAEIGTTVELEELLEEFFA